METSLGEACPRHGYLLPFCRDCEVDEMKSRIAALESQLAEAARTIEQLTAENVRVSAELIVSRERETDELVAARHEAIEARMETQRAKEENAELRADLEAASDSMNGFVVRIRETEAERDAAFDKAIRFDLDQGGIEFRERDAVELVELRAKLAEAERTIAELRAQKQWLGLSIDSLVEYSDAAKADLRDERDEAREEVEALHRTLSTMNDACLEVERERDEAKRVAVWAVRNQVEALGVPPQVDIFVFGSHRTRCDGTPDGIIDALHRVRAAERLVELI